MPAPQHAQQQILDAVRAALVAAATAAGPRVYVEPDENLPIADLPALHVAGGAEEVSTHGMHGGSAQLQERALFVRVAAIATGGAAARSLMAQVEQALLAWPAGTAPIGGLADSAELLGNAEPITEPGSKTVWRIDQTYRVRAFTSAGAPTLS